jgi:hypothetical protein
MVSLVWVLGELACTLCLHLIGAYALPLLDVFSWPCRPFFFVILQV